MAKNYIAQLFKENKQDDLEKALEQELALSPIKAVVFRYSDSNEVIMILADRDFKLIKGYKATEFDCKPISNAVLPDQFKNMERSRMTFDDNSVRKFYLRFLKNKFPTYAADYRAYINKKADLDLGETASV